MGGKLKLRTTAAWLLGAALALAQPEPSTPGGQEPESQSGEYRGPAILSRGLSALFSPDRELLRLRPFISARGVYDTGMANISVNEAGELVQQDAYGVEASFGVTGQHAWRRTLLGLQYNGRLRHYTGRTYYDGFDNYLSLNLVHRTSARTTIVVSPGVASMSRGHFSPGISSAYYSPELEALTGDEMFDNRVTAVVGSGRLIHQRTARTSFSLGGTGFTAHRRSAALVGLNGATAVGDVAYRLGRHSTLGVDYAFLHYDFQRAYGSVDGHGVALNYSTRMGRHWTLGLRGGGFRVEVTRLQLVTLDPVIAAIIGRRVAVSTDYLRRYVPNLSADLSYRFRRGSVAFRYSRSVSPGNGLYLTSDRETGGVSVTYRGTRRASFHGNVSFSQQRAVMQDLGRYRSYWSDAGMNYLLGQGLSLSASVGARKWDVRDSLYSRIGCRFTVGLSYSPGTVPLSLW
jgi:hypothetical protein